MDRVESETTQLWEVMQAQLLAAHAARTPIESNVRRGHKVTVEQELALFVLYEGDAEEAEAWLAEAYAPGADTVRVLIDRYCDYWVPVNHARYLQALSDEEAREYVRQVEADFRRAVGAVA